MSRTTDPRSVSIGENDPVEVLLVDDDEGWATSTAELLEHQREAFSVGTAFTLDAALEAFAVEDPDCVVSDYQLESGTGLELLETVRERDPQRPFVLITGQGSEDVASEAIAREVSDYVPKRMLAGRDDVLARRVETAVETYRTRRTLARERRSKEAMLDIVTASSSREGLARAFCDHLVDGRGYECAWIGTDRGGVVPQAVAGTGQYVDAVVDPGASAETGGEPALATLADGEPRFVAPVDGDEGWRASAAACGFEAAAAVPVEHEGQVVGVLAVYATEDAFDAAERDLLVEYGEVAGYALQSVEWKASLLSGTPVAVEVTVEDDRAPLVALDEGLPADAATEVLTTAPGEGLLRYVLRVDGATADEFRTAAAGVDAVEAVDVTDAGSPLRAEVVAATPTPEVVLARAGGRVVDTTVRHGRALLRVVAPGEDDVTDLLEALRSTYPDADVRSIRSGDAETPDVSGDDLLSAMTDKQRRALEFAYYQGYFLRPREHNTTEVAEKLDVSRATFTQHVRAAQRKLMAGLFDPDET